MNEKEKKEMLEELIRNYRYLIASRIFHNELLKTATVVSDLTERVILGPLSIYFGEAQDLYYQIATISALIQYMCSSNVLDQNMLINYTTAAMETITKEFDAQVEKKGKEFYEQLNDG